MSVVYEVTLRIDREIIGEFDEWLAEHLEEMLALPGFADARVFELDDDESGHACRVAHYWLNSQEDLDSYLAGAAESLRQSGIDRFGDRFSASRRVLKPAEAMKAPGGPMQECLNCDATLGGQYCGNCGQRAASRMISIWELTRDAFGDMFEFDSRLWRTLIPLLIRPGRLTRDYLEGRRARYMPPFRTYLVLSIIFFLVAFFDPQENFGIFFEDEAPPTTEEQAEAEQKVIDELAEDGIIAGPPKTEEERQVLDEIRDEVISELEKEGVLDEHPELAEQLEKGLSADAGDESPGVNLKLPGNEDKSAGITLSIDEDGDETVCDTGDLSDADIPQWLARRLTPERVQAMCDKIVADEGKTLISKVIENIPTGLIILLPLMALALKMLYPLAKRYYVEHLLFFVHFHAFFFLILTLQITFARITPQAGAAESFASLILFVSALYIPIYLYKAMRHVYGQGHFLTIPKYLMLVFVYVFGFVLMFALAVLLAAFSI